MDSLVRYFAVALAPRGITVNSVSPGGVFGPPNVAEGGIFRALPQEVQDAVQAWHQSGWMPMRRLATPADIGNAVMLLCLDEAGFITGQTLHVDGGHLSWTPCFPSKTVSTRQHFERGRDCRSNPYNRVGHVHVQSGPDPGMRFFIFPSEKGCVHFCKNGRFLPCASNA